MSCPPLRRDMCTWLLVESCSAESRFDQGFIYSATAWYAWVLPRIGAHSAIPDLKKARTLPPTLIGSSKVVLAAVNGATYAAFSSGDYTSHNARSNFVSLYFRDYGV